MGNMVATFTDYVVGAQSDSDYIQSNNNCLNVVTSEQYDMVTIEMKISKTLGLQSLPRNDRTDCRVLPVRFFFLFFFVIFIFKQIYGTFSRLQAYFKVLI